MQSKKNLMNKKTQNEWADWLQLTYVPTSSSKEVVAACIVSMTQQILVMRDSVLFLYPWLYWVTSPNFNPNYMICVLDL